MRTLGVVLDVWMMRAYDRLAAAILAFDGRAPQAAALVRWAFAVLYAAAALLVLLPAIGVVSLYCASRPMGAAAGRSRAR